MTSATTSRCDPRREAPPADVRSLHTGNEAIAGAGTSLPGSTSDAASIDPPHRPPPRAGRRRIPAAAARAARIPQAGRGRFTVELTRGRSVVSRAFATSPLRLLTPRNHGHAAWIYTSSHGGGLVDGDDIALRASVGPGATAFLSTQSATKVYRSPHGTRTALEADVGDNALLVVAPDAVICFAGSRYRQTQRINLRAGSALVLVDWVTSGRRESGERWAFDEYSSRTVVYQDERLLIHDALALRAADGPMGKRFGSCDVLAAAILVGSVLAEEIERIDARVRAEPVTRRAERLMAAAPVGDAGCVVRIAGRTVEDVDDTLRDLLAFVPGRLGDSPWARKW